MNLKDHPTVRRLSSSPERASDRLSEVVLDDAWLRRLALDCGADDAALVALARTGLDPQREQILRHYPWTKPPQRVVLRMAREALRGPLRSVASLASYRAG